MDSTEAPTKGDPAAEKADGGKSPRKTKGARGAKPAKPAKAAKAGPAPASTKADEVIEALRAASRDKDIGFDRLVAALEEAIATAARKVWAGRPMTETSASNARCARIITIHLKRCLISA